MQERIPPYCRSPWARIAPLLLLAGALPLAAAPGGAAEPASGFVQYQQTTTPRPGQPPLRMVVKLWFKGRRYRQESDSPRGKVVVIGGPSGTLVLMPGTAAATRIAPPPHRSGRPAPPPPPGIPGLMFPEAAVIPRFTKKVGSEKVGRYPATIYETRNHSGGARGMPPTEIVSRYWVSPHLPVPVKVVYQNTPGTTTTAVLQDARFNETVPDRLFQPPPGTKIHAAPGGR